MPFRLKIAETILRDFPPFRGRGRMASLLLPKNGMHIVSVTANTRMAIDFSDKFERAAVIEGDSPDVVKALLTYLDPSDTFCDIGAHVGFVTLAIASRLNQKGAVVSFEPDPHAFARLTKNIELSQGISCKMLPNQVALASACGNASLYISEQKGWSTLSQAASAVGVGLGKDIISVHMSKLDTLDHYFYETPDLPLPKAIKIDVEGWEDEVIAGGMHLLTHNPPRAVIIENNSPILTTLNKSFETIELRMQSLGYESSRPVNKMDRLFVHRSA